MAYRFEAGTLCLFCYRELEKRDGILRCSACGFAPTLGDHDIKTTFENDAKIKTDSTPTISVDDGTDSAPTISDDDVTELATTFKNSSRIEGDSTTTFSDHDLTVLATTFDEDILKLVKKTKIDKLKLNRGKCYVCYDEDDGTTLYEHLKNRHNINPLRGVRLCTCNGPCLVECVNKITYLCRLYLHTAKIVICASCCEKIPVTYAGFCNAGCQRDYEEYLDETCPWG